MANDYQFDIQQRPDFSVLVMQLQAGQSIYVEPGIMASMDSHIKLKSSLKGGLFKSVGRALGGESLIVNTFTAENKPGEVVFAPGPLGDLHHYHLDGSGNFYIQRGGFVAHGEGVELTSKWEGARGFFGEGLFLLRATGQGDIFFNTYGSLMHVDVDGEYYVDNGYVVAFEDTLYYNISTLPGLGVGSRVKSFLFGGEGLVCKFSGQGKLWIQTRTIQPFLRWVNPFRRVKRRHSN